MVQPNLGISDLGIPSDVTAKQGLRVHVTRIPFDDNFTLSFFKEGREVTEELDVEETRAWFKAHFAKAQSREQDLQRDEALQKALDEAWNFYETWINIPPDVYTEPVQRFPQYQPQV